MADIPEDLIIKILSRLPVKSLLRVKCVCKPWRSLINNQDFIKLHLDTATECNNLNLIIRLSSSSTVAYNSPFNPAKDIDYPFKTPFYSAEILGSCNGLLCISPDEDVYCLWNPSTKEYKTIAVPETSNDFDYVECMITKLTYRTICYGFGYDHTTDDYKVVRIVNCHNEFSIHVYSARIDSWRSVEDVPSFDMYQKQSGVFINGALHWAATRTSNADMTEVIGVFNLVQEVFEEMPLPDFEEDHEFQFSVGVLGGSLCLFCYVYPIELDVWVMKDYGVKNSWSMHFSISQEIEALQEIEVCPYQHLKPLCYSGEGSKVLVEKGGSTLVVYDLKSGDVTATGIHGVPCWLERTTYVESLVSLNSGCYVWQEAIGRTQPQCEYICYYGEAWLHGEGIHLIQ